MTPPLHDPTRRLFLRSAAAAAIVPFWAVRGAYAEELARTPSQTEGPFYPTKLPLDTDNDLIVINDGITPGVGEITHLTGKVLDAKGNPLKNAVVEIWQCDANGAYLHPGSDNGDKRDKNFQGFGRFVTGKTGEYYFRTIKPVPYTVRTAPHIHVMVKQGAKKLLTTQLYIKDHPGNAKDFVYLSTKDEKQRALITVPFEKVKESKTGELAANFVIVLGVTPSE
ncbi:MAG: intradiol ring-cleavage dioxygenase [Isosphaera sp.]|nr:intradiol ring-cleavage dioxygenase [Isosphaera sp.]